MNIQCVRLFAHRKQVKVKYIYKELGKDEKTQALTASTTDAMIKIVILSIVGGIALSYPFPDGLPVYGHPKPSYGTDHYQPEPYKPEPYKPVYKPDPYHKDQYKAEPKPYTFDYGVKDPYSGANYGHSEKSDGNAVHGSYQVALPDGRIQTVKYVADHHNGFQAQVEYEGEAKYPDSHHSYKPDPYKADLYKPDPYKKPHKPVYPHH